MASSTSESDTKPLGARRAGAVPLFMQLTWFRSRRTHSTHPSLSTTTRDSHPGS